MLSPYFTTIITANQIIIHQDESLIVVNKPNNVLVHHSHYARNIRDKSLTQTLRKEFGEIFPVHRLDRKTSGIILFARNKEIAKHLQSQFETNTIHKTYIALVRGHTDDKGTIKSPIKNADSGKYRDALTQYLTIEKVEINIPVNPYPTSRYSLVELCPKTGRMHQLRKHMNKISHPIIGDPKYGNRHHNHMFQEKFRHSFLFLHANKISFKDLNDRLLNFEAGFPEFWMDNLSDLGFSDLKRIIDSPGRGVDQ